MPRHAAPSSPDSTGYCISCSFRVGLTSRKINIKDPKNKNISKLDLLGKIYRSSFNLWKWPRGLVVCLPSTDNPCSNPSRSFYNGCSRARKLNFATKRQNETIEDKSIFCEGIFFTSTATRTTIGGAFGSDDGFRESMGLVQILGATPSLSHAALNDQALDWSVMMNYNIN